MAGVAEGGRRPGFFGSANPIVVNVRQEEEDEPGFAFYDFLTRTTSSGSFSGYLARGRGAREFGADRFANRPGDVPARPPAVFANVDPRSRFRSGLKLAGAPWEESAAHLPVRPRTTRAQEDQASRRGSLGAPKLSLRDTLRSSSAMRSLEACVIGARNLRRTSYDAFGLRAGAPIAVLGGRCAER